MINKKGQVVTLAEWIQFVKRTNYDPENKNGYLYYLRGKDVKKLLEDPVVDISIDDAIAFCKHESYELPTREYAKVTPKKYILWFWGLEGENIFTIGNGDTYYSHKLGMDLKYPFGDIANTYPICGEPYRSSATGLYVIPKENPIISMWREDTEDELF